METPRLLKLMAGFLMIGLMIGTIVIFSNIIETDMIPLFGLEGLLKVVNG